MTLIASYLVTTKNLEPFFNSLITAKAPEVFTQKFLESLEFKSTNDRLYIGLLKGLGFLDAAGTPTDRYYRFLDQSQSKSVLAEAIREAYSDLFAVNIKAQDLTADEVRNKLKTLTQGKVSPNVLKLMANTFSALVKYADWGVPQKRVEGPKAKPKPDDIAAEMDSPLDEEEVDTEEESSLRPPRTELHYNIQIHLPDSRDSAVYDALFKSLKKHLF